TRRRAATTTISHGFPRAAPEPGPESGETTGGVGGAPGIGRAPAATILVGWLPGGAGGTGRETPGALGRETGGGATCSRGATVVSGAWSKTVIEPVNSRVASTAISDGGPC